MHDYSLSTKEGLALMSLAEALLRVPDAATQDRLIEDKLARRRLGARGGARQRELARLRHHLGARRHRPHRASGRDAGRDHRAGSAQRLGMPTVRTAARQAMRLLGHQFVLGETIEDALARAAEARRKGYRHSFDMLGEGARTARDAERYFEAYAHAIEAIGRSAEGALPGRPGISVKLSALHPRYVARQRERVLAELTPRLIELARAAKAHELNLTVDAEEADRLELSLEVFARLLAGAVARRLGRARPCRAGLSEARAGGDRLAGRRVRGRRPAAHGAARQGRLLGHRDQARAGARACRLSGLHAQARDRSLLSRLRQAAACRAPAPLSAIRHAQRADRRGDRRAGRATRRSSSSACTAWARRSIRKCTRARATTAASTRRSAATRSFSPISCAGCSRTARTPPSSTPSTITPCRSRACSSRRAASLVGPLAAACRDRAARPPLRRAQEFARASSSAAARTWRRFVAGVAAAPTPEPVADASVEEAKAAVDAAVAGFPAWEATPADGRAAILETRRRSDRGEPRPADRASRARRRQDARRRRRGDPRGGRLLPLLCRWNAAGISVATRSSPGRPARRTAIACGAAARSSASARGIFRSRSSPARSRRRLPPATPCSPSPPSRRR